MWLQQNLNTYFMFQAFGDGSVAQVILSSNKGDFFGNFFTINWGFAIGVMMGAYVSYGVSGGHLNPAVSVAMAVSRKLSLKKVVCRKINSIFIKGSLCNLKKEY